MTQTIKPFSTDKNKHFDKVQMFMTIIGGSVLLYGAYQGNVMGVMAGIGAYLYGTFDGKLMERDR